MFVARAGLLIVKALRPVPPIRRKIEKDKNFIFTILRIKNKYPKDQANSRKLNSHAGKIAIVEMFANGNQTNR